MTDLEPDIPGPHCKIRGTRHRMRLSLHVFNVLASVRHVLTSNRTMRYLFPMVAVGSGIEPEAEGAATDQTKKKKKKKPKADDVSNNTYTHSNLQFRHEGTTHTHTHTEGEIYRWADAVWTGAYLLID